MSANSFAQGHFVVAFQGNGQDHMNITVITAAIGGVDLEAGDEIAAFDGIICSGKAILAEPIVITNSSTFAAIAASRKDDDSSNGYTIGHTITYKLWDSSKRKESSGITAEYLDPITGLPITAPNYSVNGSAFVKLTVSASVNQMPASNAGSDQTVNEGGNVTLDGLASSDPDSDPLIFKWIAPAGIILSSLTADKPSFTAPEVTADTDFTFSLVVNDGKVNSTTDAVVITVKQVNKLPIANAGSNQSVNEGATAALDGSASSDPDSAPLTFKWTAPAGITLSSMTVDKPTFTAPEVSSDTNFTFSLVVNDGINDSQSDQVTVTVNLVNMAPTANAGPDQSVNEAALITLDGTGSADPDINVLTYTWTPPSGISLSSTTVSKPTFTPPEVIADTQYKFSLVVNDGQVNSPPDEVVITVVNFDKAPYVKDPIENVSVDKGAPDQIINLKTVFADDDIGDILSYSVTSNANDQVVTAKITGTDLTLSFSAENTGLSEIEVTAISNGKDVKSKFKVEVKILAGTNSIIRNQNMIIYPNPTSGKVKVVFDRILYNGTYLTVNDVTGKTILKQFIQNKEEWFDLKGNKPGLYLIKTNLNNMMVQKAILQ